ncbi:tetratricopeptide repeat protein [Actinacidiphila bryophytorum]|uniref:Thioredoxin n=1 Tax=Actinacidiphila bryophytorum TaxID=1436133 RepID=A0A9W4E312_9ACTN|nr:tetratricopeptide repeat protein [Actinacidiphila bryophytorum]MBM9435410.1 tetratricopeptide repeat protein [Actinacidiphila bryophytorum]MBN6542265.1 tetratricopeptide repeat protein [Actinacidiphila bryophytorum]CAG7607797.1 Putative thioredoxin [Actinacidiphila bryophytorum]
MQPRNMSMSGVVDLAAVKAAGEAKAKAEQARAQRQDAGADAPAASPLVIEVTEATFESDVLQRSAEVPVVISFWADQAEQSKQLNAVLERLAGEYRGRFVLATAEVYANQLLFQQFGVQGVPAVFAVLAGQAMPLFQGLAPEDQVTEVLDQLIAVAEQRFGIVGQEVDPGTAPAQPQEPAPPRPATPQELALTAAHDALDAGDLSGAIRAYRNVLADEPANAEAKLGLAQAQLLDRVQGVDPQAARTAAADAPGDVQAQLTAADLDLVGGHVEDAFGRLVDTVRRTFGDERDTVRVRLLELFEVIGPDDPRVVAARTALARVLF